MKTQAQIKTILCPIDFSKNSSNAMHYAAAIAKKISSKLMLLHVYAPPISYHETPIAVIANAENQFKKLAEKD